MITRIIILVNEPSMKKTGLPLRRSLPTLLISLLFSTLGIAQITVEKGLDMERELNALQARLPKAPHDAALWIDIWQLESSLDQTDTLISQCRRELRHARNAQDQRLALYANLMMTQAFIKKNLLDSVLPYFEQSKTLAPLVQDPWANAVLCNTAGIIAIDHEGNYPKGISYFIKGQRITQDDSSRIHYILLTNLALTCSFRGDTNGLEYATAIYRHGKQASMPFWQNIGALSMANMYCLKHQYDSALHYASHALKLSDEASLLCQAYTLLGKIKEATGEKAEAEKAFLQALEYCPNPDIIATIELYIEYSRHLINNKKSQQAITFLKQGLQLAEARNGKLYRYQLYSLLAEACRQQGEYRKALDYYDSALTASVQQFNTDKEQSIAELRMRYDMEAKDKEIHRQELLILKANQKLAILIGILTLSLLSAGFIYLLYLRRNRMYRNIVKQYHAFKEREKLHETASSKASSSPALPATEPESNGTPSQTETKTEKEKEIYALAEKLMREKRLYRDGSLSLEKLAMETGTNRTYLSNALNHYARTSFNSYVNNWRIQESIDILSDPSQDVALKELAAYLGFNSLSTFYRSFQTAMDMPPSRFRKESLNLLKNKS